MAQLGYGYGSEFQLLRFMGRHRDELERTIKQAIGEEGNMHWLEFDYVNLDETFIGDQERWGVAFLEDLKDFVSDEQRAAINKEISDCKVTRMVSAQCWDAVFTLNETVYLVEAKAYCEELISDCGSRASRQNILMFIKKQLPTLNVRETWLHEYYQLANRLATTAMLNNHGIKAKTMYLFFENGYKRKYMANKKLMVMQDKDTTRAQFEDAIKVEMEALGITHELVKDILAPYVFINANPVKRY